MVSEEEMLSDADYRENDDEREGGKKKMNQKQTKKKTRMEKMKNQNME